MHKAERLVVGLVLAAVAGCGGGRAGGSAGAEVPEGASSPETAVENFLSAAKEAYETRRAGEFPAADRAYARMAAVFGTEHGSIRRSFPGEEVRSRMIVLSTCLRPVQYTIISRPDPDAWRNEATTVTVDLDRPEAGTSSLPFSVVLGRDDRWFIERIDLTDFAC